MVGDLAWGTDGQPTEVVKVHEPLDDHPLLKVTFSDGRSVTVGANHLWDVSTKPMRAAWCPGQERPRDARRELFVAEAARVRALAESLPVGTFGTIDEIAACAALPKGVGGSSTLRGLGIEQMVHYVPRPTQRAARMFDAWAVADYFAQRPGTTIARKGLRFGAVGDLRTAAKDMAGWMTVQDMANVLVGSRATRDERNMVKRGLRPCGWWAFRGDCLGAYWSLPVMAATV